MPRCNRRSWMLIRIVLLCCILVKVYSFSCSFPCVRERCERVRPESCTYGLVNDTCLCCPVCGQGPGDECGDLFGFCGRGLECFHNPPTDVPANEHIFVPGQCQVRPNPPTSESVLLATSAAATQLAQTTLPSAEVSTQASSPSVRRTTEQISLEDSTTSVATADGLGIETTAVTSEVISNCRYPTCSVEYCTGSTRRRICSAKELAHTPLPNRGYCQYTSCRACFLYTRPPCTTTCRDLPVKPCLRRYDECVDNYLLSSGNSSIIRLTDPNISSFSGRIMCHVPGVSHT